MPVIRDEAACALRHCIEHRQAMLAVRRIGVFWLRIAREARFGFPHFRGIEQAAHGRETARLAAHEPVGELPHRRGRDVHVHVRACQRRAA